MAPRTVPTSSTRARVSRGRQSKREQEDYEIPEVYREMLAEAEARDTQGSETDRPMKKRRVGEKTAFSSQLESTGQEIQAPESNEDVGQPMQTAYDSTASEESDVEWEEIDIQQAPPNYGDQGISVPNDEPLQITLDQQKDNTKRVISRRKPVTGAEKKLRLVIHKIHLLCLLGHVQIRNLWCNDEQIQGSLKQVLPRKVIALLNPAEDGPQYTRSTTFVDGLNQAGDAFVRRFRVVKPGMQRAHWADDATSLKKRVEAILSNAEVMLSRDDFRKQAMTLQGSRDFGAQLFCALLRSVAVEARLVCSLQPLPFSGAAVGTTSRKPDSQSIIITPEEDNEANNLPTPDVSAPLSRTRRLGQPQFAELNAPKMTVRTGPRPSVRQSLYPVFWVEAYNEAVQKWIPIDPLVTKSLAKPSKFEPPASDQYNAMCYVVAFEDDASARDVTRRYAKAFNAKTRKMRVESTRNGEIWWERVLQFYEKPFLEDRDEAEISELTAKMAAEPMPRNVQDFKDHPVYALERHLRRNEVIFPKRVIGQVSLGKSGSKNQTLVPVYRRTDIHTCRSADRWYRLGRDIKIGEQPLKRVPKNRNRFDTSEDEDPEVPVYAYFQTDVYKPPPIVQGRIPKNVYGNLDIYVPSMVPPGGTHIMHPGASRAAKILGVDYADAVTGFDFKGRHGTAVTRGVVIANNHREALEEVLDGLEQERLQAESQEKSAEALGMWKHFLLKLRIARRVQSYAVEEDKADEANLHTDEPAESGNGFFLDRDQASGNPHMAFDFPQPAQEIGSPEPASTEPEFEEDEVFGGGFVPEETLEEVDQPQRLPSNDTGHLNESHRPESSHFKLVVATNNKTNYTGDVNLELDTNTGTLETAQTGARNEVETPGQDASKAFDGTADTPSPMGSTAAGDSGVTNIRVPSRPASTVGSKASSSDGGRKGVESNDEGSLMSEDPEDEDAIPEWLM